MIILDDIIRKAEQAKDAIQDKQEQDSVDYLVFEALTDLMTAVIKQQEPSKPTRIRTEYGIKGGDCPNCQNWLHHCWNFCPYCRQAVTW